MDKIYFYTVLVVLGIDRIYLLFWNIFIYSF